MTNKSANSKAITKAIAAVALLSMVATSYIAEMLLAALYTSLPMAILLVIPATLSFIFVTSKVAEEFDEEE